MIRSVLLTRSSTKWRKNTHLTILFKVKFAYQLILIIVACENASKTKKHSLRDAHDCLQIVFEIRCNFFHWDTCCRRCSQSLVLLIIRQRQYVDIYYRVLSTRHCPRFIHRISYVVSLSCVCIGRLYPRFMIRRQNPLICFRALCQKRIKIHRLYCDDLQSREPRSWSMFSLRVWIFASIELIMRSGITIRCMEWFGQMTGLNMSSRNSGLEMTYSFVFDHDVVRLN